MDNKPIDQFTGHSSNAGIFIVPERMNAVRLHSAGGPAGLIYEQIGTPQPGAGEVLVRVHAAAITRDELEWPVNRLPAIPCYEFSGVICAAGRELDDGIHGKAVYGLSAFDKDGAAAEYMVISPELLAAAPKTLDPIKSASIPLAAMTAWQGLFDHGHLTAGQRVLIHGAAGGVGSFAVQLAHSAGAYVIATVSSANMEAARMFGADEVIDHTTTRFEQAAGQVDLVFDTAGGERLERSPAMVRPGGRLVSVATEPSQAQAAVNGITALYFVVSPNSSQLFEITALVDSGKLQTKIDRVFALAEARQAFERSLGAHPAGKIVLHIAGE